MTYRLEFRDHTYECGVHLRCNSASAVTTMAAGRSRNAMIPLPEDGLTSVIPRTFDNAGNEVMRGPITIIAVTSIAGIATGRHVPPDIVLLILCAGDAIGVLIVIIMMVKLRTWFGITVIAPPVTLPSAGGRNSARPNGPSDFPN